MSIHHNTRVLVVDDNETNLYIARDLIKRYDMQVDCLGGGPEAIEVIRDEKVRYDAVFMDHMMPGMDGIEATRRIRGIGTDYAKNIPVIAFTANAIVGNKEMLLQNGFQGFLSKPIEPGQLDAVIREWVRGEKTESVKLKIDSSDASPDSQKLLRLKAKLSSLDPQIEGIDLNKGIERFGGDGGSYADVLRTYVRNTRHILETIGDINESNMAGYAAIVHGIKGASRGICADNAADLADTLETAAKNDEYGFVKANNTVFIKTVHTLLSDIGAILAQIRDDDPKPVKDRPDAEALAQLYRACVSHDMEKADTIITGLEGYEYETGGELVPWLRENAELMNCAEIAQELGARSASI